MSMDAPPLRIVVADDQRAVREALATVLDAEPGLQVVGLAADGDEAVDLARQFSPDVVLPREADVLRSIATGQTNGEIATSLFISEVTVKSHVNHLFAKIGARSRAEAVRYAYDHSIVSPRP